MRQVPPKIGFAAKRNCLTVHKTLSTLRNRALPHHSDAVPGWCRVDRITRGRSQDVTKTFGAGPDAVAALDNVSVTIGQNEFFTLLGPSGCGKTTLLRLIAGFEMPSSGGILLEGQEVAHLPPFRRPVNTVFQSYALFPHLTVAQNIGFGLKMLGRKRKVVDDTVTAMLKLVRMEPMRNRKVHQLSGGQQQRVALARALAPHPKVCCSTSRCRRSI